jgi:Uma2 family endonuclease
MWQHSDVSAQEPERLTVEEYLAVAPDNFGDIEVVDGLVVRSMAQSELHSLVVRRLAAAESSRPDHRLNARYPDIFIRDCEPYDVNTVRNHIRLIVEVTSESTFKADTTEKRVMYAAAGIPGYLVVHFDKGWGQLSEIEEYRLDWSGRRYVVHTVHRRALILDEPLRLTVTFEDLQRP